MFCFDAYFNASKPIREVVIFCLMMAATKTVYATDEGEADMVSAIEQLEEIVNPLRPVE